MEAVAGLRDRGFGTGDQAGLAGITGEYQARALGRHPSAGQAVDPGVAGIDGRFGQVGVAF
jgi:hypothetical protein